MSSNPSRFKNTLPVIAPEDGATPPSDSKEADSISETEAATLRQEKLATIKKAIEAGAYDSEELLEKAMNRMRDMIENGKEPQ